jgi:ABC-type transport system involved in multi-copper enzyme maturation permease subunit
MHRVASRLSFVVRKDEGARSRVKNLLYIMFKSYLRDRVLHAVLGVALLLFLLVPAFSLFSMRQVQELAITLSLSAISSVLLVLAVLLGASSVWRDIERRYTTSLLGLPVSRGTYVVGKFLGIALLLLACGLLLGVVSGGVISVAASQYRSDIPIHWFNIGMAVFADSLKYILLAAVALLFSVLSTSFFLPVFGTISVYLAGSASQEVYEYISGDYAKSLSPVAKKLIAGVYYVLPNFAAFQLKVQAIYGLPLSPAGLGYMVLYFLVYTAILLSLSVWVFNRRELL